MLAWFFFRKEAELYAICQFPNLYILLKVHRSQILVRLNFLSRTNSHHIKMMIKSHFLYTIHFNVIFTLCLVVLFKIFYKKLCIKSLYLILNKFMQMKHVTKRFYSLIFIRSEVLHKKFSIIVENHYMNCYKKAF